MRIETTYLVADNGRFVCADPVSGYLFADKERADALCKFEATFDDAASTVALRNPTTGRGWVKFDEDWVTPDLAHVVRGRMDESENFKFSFVDETKTLVTLQDRNGDYLSRSVFRDENYLIADQTEHGASSQFRFVHITP